MLMRNLKKKNFIKVYDLQNSSRTKFYKNILFPKANFNTWSSSETTLPSNISKDEFDKDPVLNRFDHQLKTSGIKTEHTMRPNFNWAVTNIDNIKQEIKNMCAAADSQKKDKHLFHSILQFIDNPENLDEKVSSSGWKYTAFKFYDIIINSISNDRR